MKITTPQDIINAVSNGLLRLSHSSLARGYESRRGQGSVAPYEGRFGSGYIHRQPNMTSTQYVHVTYYIADASNA